MARTLEAISKAPVRRDADRGREEDRLDVEAAERVERAAIERGDEPIPWEVARRGIA